MNAETIARALGGRKAGGGWTAPRPAHSDLSWLAKMPGCAVRLVVVLAHLASCPNGQNPSPSEIGCTGARTLDFLKLCCIERIAGNCGVAMA